MTKRAHPFAPFARMCLLSAVSAVALSGCASGQSGGATTAAAAPAPVAQVVAATPAAARPELGSFGFDLAGMDRSVAAGDDFYAFANGTWARTTVIPDDKSNYGMFTRLGDLSLERTRAILEEDRNNPSSAVGRAYASYLDEAAVEARGLAAINPWLTQIRAVRTRADYVAASIEATRHGISGPFAGYVNQDDRQPDRYLFIMQQSGIGMPDRDYYLGDAQRFVDLRARYVSYLETMLTLAGETNAAARAQAIMAFETRLAQAHWDKVDASDATKTYNLLTISELQRIAPGFDFTSYLRGIGVRNDEVIVGQPTAFTAMAREIGRAPVGVLRDQMIVRSLSAYATMLPRAIGDADFAFNSTALSGTPQQEPRWKRAVRFTEGVLGDELSQEYVARHFPPATKAAMDTLVSNVLAALGRRIDNLTWMQPETKRRARAKLENTTVKIGYPSQWRSYEGLDIRRDDLFGNAWRSAVFEHDYQLGKIGTPVRRWEWFMTPMT
ncbi:MAG: M13 family metallopeptidase, partial [Sphingopyxis sp.]|nr:M13 family metallopeptidase [Sphingopyxis sp.]